MTEQDFDQRLTALIRDSQANTVDGIGDVFSAVFGAVKTVVAKVGTGLAGAGSTLMKGVVSLGKGVFSVGGKIVGALGGSAGKTLLETGSAVYVAKKSMDMQRQELTLQTALAEKQQTELQAALAAQGINIASPQAQQLMRDVVNGGIKDANGNVIYPAIGQQMQSAGMGGTLIAGIPLTTILMFAGVALAAAIVLPGRSNDGPSNPWGSPRRGRK